MSLLAFVFILLLPLGVTGEHSCDAGDSSCNADTSALLQKAVKVHDGEGKPTEQQEQQQMMKQQLMKEYLHGVGAEAGADEENKEGDEVTKVPEVMAKDDKSAMQLSAVQAMAAEKGVLYDNATKAFPEANMDGPLTWFLATTAQTKNAVAFCESQGKYGRKLCSYSEICPYGTGIKDEYFFAHRVSKPRWQFSYPQAADMWVPYSGDDGNAWVQVGKWPYESFCGTNCGPVGTTNQGTTCVKHHDLWQSHYGRPSWGKTPDQLPSIRGWIACCEHICPDYWKPKAGEDGTYLTCADCCKGGTVPAKVADGMAWQTPGGGCCEDNYDAFDGYNCKNSQQQDAVVKNRDVAYTAEECKRDCDQDPHCTGVLYKKYSCHVYHEALDNSPGTEKPGWTCYRKQRKTTCNPSNIYACWAV